MAKREKGKRPLPCCAPGWGLLDQSGDKGDKRIKFAVVGIVRCPARLNLGKGKVGHSVKAVSLRPFELVGSQKTAIAVVPRVLALGLVSLLLREREESRIAPIRIPDDKLRRAFRPARRFRPRWKMGRLDHEHDIAASGADLHACSFRPRWKIRLRRQVGLC